MHIQPPLHSIYMMPKRLLFYWSSWKTRTQKTNGNNSAKRNLHYIPKRREKVLLFPPPSFYTILSSLSYKISIYFLFHGIANLHPIRINRTSLIRIHDQPCQDINRSVYRWIDIPITLNGGLSSPLSSTSFPKLCWTNTGMRPRPWLLEC